MHNETEDLKQEMARVYGFRQIEDWHWVSTNEPYATARLQADGQAYVARLYSETEQFTTAHYHTSLMRWIEYSGIPVEAVIPTALGSQLAILSNGKTVVLSVFHPVTTVPLPISHEDVVKWGVLTARIHVACERWCPDVHVPTALLRSSPRVMLIRAMDLACGVPESKATLVKFDLTIVPVSEHVFNVGTKCPVHGDLWPGNLLKETDGLRVIDFQESGDGTPVVDMATAYRWMPWRENSKVAHDLWQAWLEAYRQIREPSEIEVNSIMSVACLQQLYWLIEEIKDAHANVSAQPEIAWYVNDHCETIEAILASAA